MRLELGIINRLQLFLHFSVWALNLPCEIVISPLWPHWKGLWNVVCLTPEIVLGQLERGVMGRNAFKWKPRWWKSYLTSDCCLTLNLYLWILTKRPYHTHRTECSEQRALLPQTLLKLVVDCVCVLAVSFNLIKCMCVCVCVCVSVCLCVHKSIVIYNSLHPCPTTLYTHTHCLFNIAWGHTHIQMWGAGGRDMCACVCAPLRIVKEGLLRPSNLLSLRDLSAALPL